MKNLFNNLFSRKITINSPFYLPQVQFKLNFLIILLVLTNCGGETEDMPSTPVNTIYEGDVQLKTK